MNAWHNAMFKLITSIVVYVLMLFTFLIKAYTSDFCACHVESCHVIFQSLVVLCLFFTQSIMSYNTMLFFNDLINNRWKHICPLNWLYTCPLNWLTLVVLGTITRIVHNYHENMLEMLVRLTLYGVKQISQCGFEMSSIFMKVSGYWFLCVLVCAWPLNA